MERISSQRGVREACLLFVAGIKDVNWLCDLQKLMCSSATYNQSSLQDPNKEGVHYLYIFPSKKSAVFLNQGRFY